MRAQQGGGYCSPSSLYRQATDLMQAHAFSLCCLSLERVPLQLRTPYTTFLVSVAAIDSRVAVLLE